ncbi:MAG: ribosomal-protein-alanine N-acetyltransferase [Burkholderiaceae bacterium]|jgi:ribosomal-protein-alanine N-acetyltransferase
MPCGYCTLRMVNPLAEKVLHTDRLILTPLKVAHAAAMFDGLLDAGSYAFLPDVPLADVAALAARYERLEHRRSPDGREIWLNWVIGFTDAPHLCGYVQFTVQPYARRAMVAYFVFAPFRQQGVAREAVAAALAEVIAHFPLAHVDAEIDTRNAASIALIERLGFVRQRLVRNADRFKGAVSDEVHYAFVVPASLPGV